MNLERQLAEAIKARTDYFTAWQRARTKRNKAIEQRDRLAEALRHALRFVRAYESQSTSAMDDKWATEEQAEQALAALNQQLL